MATGVRGNAKRAAPHELLSRAKPKAHWNSRRYRRRRAARARSYPGKNQRRSSCRQAGDAVHSLRSTAIVLQ